MSTYFFTNNLSLKDLQEKEKTLNENEIFIQEHKGSYFLEDKSCKQGICIDMNSIDDPKIGFSRYGSNYQGCGNILSLICDLFPDCGLISEYDINETEDWSEYDVGFLRVES